LKVTVRTVGPFSERIGFREITVNLKGQTVGDFLEQLCEEHGSNFRETVFNKEGSIRPYIKLLINGRGLHVLQGLKTILHDGDIIAIFPPIAGGA
jgi:molybdopterin synthase sulfur carrier subunit